MAAQVRLNGTVKFGAVLPITLIMKRSRTATAACLAATTAFATLPAVSPAAAAEKAPTAGIASVAVQGVAAPDSGARTALSATAQAYLAEHGIKVDRSSEVSHVTGVDPYRNQQWGYDAVQAPKASTASTGLGITVAVVDSGVSKVTDLADKVLTGKDFIASGDGTADGKGHGTGVASIIAATVGNSVGLAGIAPDVKILPVRVCDNAGSCPADAVAAGILWAVDHGAQVINLSLGGSDTTAQRSAVAYAESKSIPVIGSVGNSAESGNPVLYPGAYDTVIGVAAVDSSLNRASFSEYGSQVDIAAPGVGIVQAAPGNKYTLGSGTSQAAPHVTAAVALAKAYKSSLTPAAMRTLVTGTATDLGATGRDDQFGYGLVNAAKMLTNLGATVTTPSASPSVPAPTLTAASPVTGSSAGGTTVTLTGTNFTGVDPANPNAVMFGDTPATDVTVLSSTKLTAVAPAAANGTVVVRVLGTAGASTSTSVTFSLRTPLGASFTDTTAKLTGGTVIPVTVTGGTVGATAKEFAAEKITARVGEVVAQVAYVDATHVKVTAPATTKATAVSMQLFHDGVAGPASTAKVNYAPTVTTVAPNKVSAEGGTKVVITGSGFLGVDASDPTAVRFGSANATSFTVVSATSITAVVPAGAGGTVALTVKTSGGTTATQLTYRAPLTITVPSGTAAKASGGTVTLGVTGGTLGATAKDFSANKITLASGKTAVPITYVDATHFKATLPASTAGTISLTLSVDGIAGPAATVNYVPVVTSLSASSDTVAGGKKITVQIAAPDAANARDFRFGDTAATCTRAGTSFSCVVPAAAAAGPTWIRFTTSSGAASRFTPAATFSYTDLD